MAMADDWGVHLGVGLILCTFGRYEDSFSSLVHCHQVAIQSGDECREIVAEKFLVDAARRECIITGSEFKVLFSLFSHLSRYNSCPLAAKAWAGFFVARIFDKSDHHASMWLKNTLLCAAQSSQNLWRIKYIANRLLFQLSQEWTTKVHHFKLLKEAAAELDELKLVHAIYIFGVACFTTYNFVDAIRIRAELLARTSGSDDDLLRGMSERFCGNIAIKLGQYEESLTHNFRALRCLKSPPPASWSDYIGYCSTPGFKSLATSRTPHRDMLSNSCIGGALLRIVEAQIHVMQPELALAAVEEYERHLKRNLLDSTPTLNELCLVECSCKISRIMMLAPNAAEKWYDQAESSLARALELSSRLGSIPSYISTLLCVGDMVEILRIRRDGYRQYYLREDSQADVSYFETIDSFHGEAENLARLHFPEALLNVLCLRMNLFFRIGKMELVIDKSKAFWKLFLEAGYKFRSFSSGQILFSEQLKESFRLLQVALCARGEGHSKYATVAAERGRARDLLYSIKSSGNAERFKEKLMEFDVDDEKALEEIKSIAAQDEDTVFLVYTSVMERYGLCYCLVHRSVIAEGFIKYDQPNGFAIEICVRETIKSIRDESNDTFDLLRFWYRQLIAPLEDHLERINPKKLVIVPPEHLSGLPFAALHKDAGEPFLVQRFAISYAPSLRMYAECKHRGEALMQNSRRASALVIGNPSEDLTYAEAEAQQVRDSLHGAGFQDIQLLQRDAATKSAFLERLSTSDWIHFAGHAEASNEFPQGALRLAPEPAETHNASEVKNLSDEFGARSSSSSSAHDQGEADRGMRLWTLLQQRPRSGVLTGDDIQASGVKIQALVTLLSACQSGVGENFAEGVLGLYRALHVAGAPSVVCSLWNLDDSSAKSMIEKLYQRLLAGMELSLALQEVMVEMIDEEFDENSLIRNWAALIISGNPDMKLC